MFWGWDTFVLLMLYWIETVVIAFWTLMRILIGADFSGNIFGEVLSRLFMFAFFLVHAGGFMLGHFIFLWTFYARDWSGRIQVTDDLVKVAPLEFWDKMIVANGLLLPLAISLIGRGVAFVIEMARLPLWKRLVGHDTIEGRSAGELVRGLYGRIVIMHLVILGGASLAQKYGALAPLVMLIVAKTIIDLWFFVRIDLKGSGVRAAAQRPS